MNTSATSETQILTEPSDGPAHLVANQLSYNNALSRLGHGAGPFAVDAERASGFRYGNRNYLVQVRREGSGTFLFDPTAIEDFTELNAVMQDDTWLFHAATQDLIPLGEQGLIPPTVFDTEVAARLLGLERVNLAAVTTHFLGLTLAKEHSHQDWSTRPLPDSWLNYAALDVELLSELAERETDQLKLDGKYEWALEEFEHLRVAPATTRTDPWRRTSGIQTIRDRRKLAVLRELWLEREKIARSRDIAPGRILPDRALTQAATTLPRSVGALLSLHDFGGTANRRRAHQWERAISRALAMPADELPPLRLPASPKAPPIKQWEEKSPLAAKRYEPAKAFVDKLAEDIAMPVENVLQPKLLRQLVWDSASSAIQVNEYLRSNGARQWQINLVDATLQELISS